MAVTPNYGLFVYGAEDTSVRFLDFRVNIAGTQSTSNFYVIDTKMKEMSDKIQILENSPSAYSVNATYSSENYYTASSLDFPGYETNQLISLSLDRNNIGTVTININSSSTVSVMKYNNSGNLVNMDDNDFTINNPILCIYDGTRFVAIGVKNANNINISGNEGEIVVVSPENKLVSSGKKIGEANGVASLDSSGNVQQPANSTVNSLTISLNGNAQTPFNGGNPVSFNITPKSISAATSEQGQSADDLVSGNIPAGKATILATPRKIGNAEFDGSKDVSGSEIGIPNHNILDNTDFTNVVNQRGQTSYSSPGYCIDRWQILNASYDVESHTITLNPVATSFASAFLSQYVHVSALPAADVPLTVSASINGTVFSATGKRSDASFEELRDKVFADVSVSDYCELIMGASDAGDKIFINIENKEGSSTSESLVVDWVKLEVGSIATPWQPKGYGAELTECQRYYQIRTVMYQSYESQGTTIQIPFQYSLMRIENPTGSFVGTPYYFNSSFASFDIKKYGAGILLTVGGTNGLAAFQGNIALSADL